MTTTRDDERLGQLFRLLRVRAGLTQEAMAAAAAVPVRDIQKLEDGRAALVLLERLRRLFAKLDARVKLSVWWNGAAADRLLDERHARIVERSAAVMARRRWETPTEVSFSEYGERGSIDLLGLRRDFEAAAVCEIKSTFGSLEEMNRTLDVKVRLAPTICRNRFGWKPTKIGRLVIVPDTSTMRRFVRDHHQTMNALYPSRGREIRSWLRTPVGNLGGIWFLSDPHDTRGSSGREA